MARLVGFIIRRDKLFAPAETRTPDRAGRSPLAIQMPLSSSVTSSVYSTVR